MLTLWGLLYFKRNQLYKFKSLDVIYLTANVPYVTSALLGNYRNIAVPGGTNTSQPLAK